MVFIGFGSKKGGCDFGWSGLGAQGVYIGRPYLYGLGAGGQEGVEHALEIIRKEMSLTMALCGETNVGNVGLDNLDRVSSDFLSPDSVTTEK